MALSEEVKKRIRDTFGIDIEDKLAAEEFIAAVDGGGSDPETQVIKTREYVYDFDEDGGALGFISLSAKDGYEPLPDHCIITYAFIKVEATLNWGNNQGVIKFTNPMGYPNPNNGIGWSNQISSNGTNSGPPDFTQGPPYTLGLNYTSVGTSAPFNLPQDGEEDYWVEPANVGISITQFPLLGGRVRVYISFIETEAP